MWLIEWVLNKLAGNFLSSCLRSHFCQHSFYGVAMVLLCLGILSNVSRMCFTVMSHVSWTMSYKAGCCSQLLHNRLLFLYWLHFSHKVSSCFTVLAQRRMEASNQWSASCMPLSCLDCYLYLSWPPTFWSSVNIPYIPLSAPFIIFAFHGAPKHLRHISRQHTMMVLLPILSTIHLQLIPLSLYHLLCFWMSDYTPDQFNCSLFPTPLLSCPLN